MRRIGLVVLAACGGTAPVAPPPQSTPSPTVLRFRAIQLGTQRGHAVRTTFTLDLEHATADETIETLAKRVTLTDAERDTGWTAGPPHHYHGTRTATSDGFDLALAGDAQPLALHCVQTSVDAAAAGAVPVITPEIADDAPCDSKSGWSPAGTTPVAATVCVPAGTSIADADADDRFAFAPPPGLEFVDENDDCGPHLGGIRRARP